VKKAIVVLRFEGWASKEAESMILRIWTDLPLTARDKALYGCCMTKTLRCKQQTSPPMFARSGYLSASSRAALEQTCRTNEFSYSSTIIHRNLEIPLYFQRRAIHGEHIGSMDHEQLAILVLHEFFRGIQRGSSFIRPNCCTKYTGFIGPICPTSISTSGLSVI
jgi:hypothetical protein